MSLYRRGEIWWGRWRFKGQSDIAESSGTGDQQAAQEWHDNRAVELWRLRRLGERPGASFSQAALEWWGQHAQHKRSAESDALTLSELTPLIGDEWLAAINTARLNRLREQLRRPGRGDTRINRFLSTVSAVLHYAHRRDLIANVPAIPKTKEAKATPRFLTPEQATALLAELPPHLNRMARFALATGLRDANVCELEWSRVDLSRRCLWIDGENAKAGRSIAVPLADAAAYALRECLGDDPRYVFVWRGKPINGASNSAWSKARVRAGVPWVRWHDLRHTWASWHVMAGTPLEVLQKLGGWADVKIVQRYAHLSPGFMAQWANNSGTYMGTVGVSEKPETPENRVFTGATDGVRTHDNWNHNPVSRNVMGLKAASGRGIAVRKPSHNRKKTA